MCKAMFFAYMQTAPDVGIQLYRWLQISLIPSDFVPILWLGEPSVSPRVINRPCSEYICEGSWSSHSVAARQWFRDSNGDSSC